MQADLHGFQIWPVLKAESVAELAPSHELIKELLAAVAAVAHQVTRHLEGRDHAKVVICCTHTTLIYLHE